MATALQMGRNIRTMATSMSGNIQRALYAESQNLLQDFKSRSPVDSGFYKRNWKVSRNRYRSGDVFASVNIYNRTPYAFWMEFGAPENEAPWYYPGTKKRTGKLIRRNGRVWAGGLNPGHAETVGGSINPVLAENEPRLRKLSNLIADSVIGGLK